MAYKLVDLEDQNREAIPLTHETIEGATDEALQILGWGIFNDKDEDEVFDKALDVAGKGESD